MASLGKHASIAALIALGVGVVSVDTVYSTAAFADSAITTGTTIYSSTNIRSGPSTSTSIVGHVSGGSSLSGTVSNGWMHITSGSYSGRYVAMSTLKVTSTSPAPSSPSGTITAKTTYPSTNIRTGASTSNSISTTVRSGTLITGTLSNGWIHITAPSNLAGKYVSYSVLQYVSSGTTTPTNPVPPTNPTSPVTPPTIYPLNGQPGCTSNPVLSTTNGSNTACVLAVRNVLNSWIFRTDPSGAQVLSSRGRTYDAATASDVRLFQSMMGIAASGQMDSATWKALSAASSSTTDTPSESITGAPGDSHPAFPSAIKLADGRLMIVFTSSRYHGAPGATTWKTYSSDGGYSWTKPQRIYLPNGMENSVGGLGIATSGPLTGHPILTTWSVATDGGHHTQVAISADLEGDNWGPLTDVVAVTGSNTFTASPIVQVDDTNFQQAVYVYAGQSNTSARTVGLTYNGTQFVVGSSAVIASAAATASTQTPTQIGSSVSTTTTNAVATTGGFSEVGEIKLGDGRLFALVRNDTTQGQAIFWKSYSSDGGKTWTQAVQAFAGSGAPRIGMTSDGKLVVLYRHFTGASNTGASQGGNMDAVYRVSTDNGASWGDEQSVGVHSPFEMVYGTPVANADGTVTFILGSESSPGSATSPGSSTIVTQPNVPVKR